MTSQPLIVFGITGRMGQSLIEALLFLARGESDGPAPQPCALDQIVREAVEVVATGAAVKSLQLNVEVEPVVVAGAPVMVACFVLGLAWIVVFYLAGPSVPGMSGLGNWNIVIGMGLFIVGFVFSTQWK